MPTWVRVRNEKTTLSVVAAVVVGVAVLAVAVAVAVVVVDKGGWFKHDEQRRHRDC